MAEIKVGDRVVHTADRTKQERNRDHGKVVDIVTVPFGPSQNLITWVHVQWDSRTAGEIDFHPEPNIKHCDPSQHSR